MLKQNDDSDTRERPPIEGLLERLLQEGRDWAAAEAALARVGLADAKRRTLRMIAFAAVAFAAALCMVIALAEAAIAALAAELSLPLAAVVVALAFAVIAGGCGIAAWKVVDGRKFALLRHWRGNAR